MGLAPDVMQLAIQRRALVSGRRKPKAGVVPLAGDLEVYFKTDKEFGPMLVMRKKTSTIRSAKVKNMNAKLRACAQWVDKEVLAKTTPDETGRRKAVSRAEIRELFRQCLTGKVAPKV